MRRLGYLKPLLYKGSRSELFPNQLPSAGMETTLYSPERIFPEILLSKSTPLSGDGNQKPYGNSGKNTLTFQINSPQRGWKRVLVQLYLGGKLTFQINSPQRGWKQFRYCESDSCVCFFPNQLPSAGMETFMVIFHFKKNLPHSFQINSPQRGWKHYSSGITILFPSFPNQLPSAGMETAVVSS